MKLTFDMETRSIVDLKACGLSVYAESPTTEILCIAFKLGEGGTELWIPEKFATKSGINSELTKIEVANLIARATTIEAHNIQFELALWENVMVKRYSFLPLPLNKLRCSAAKAASFALPRALAFACMALNLGQQKDIVGHRIMMKMCKPRKPLKAEREVNPDWEQETYWHEKPDDFSLLFEYCRQDVVAEHDLSNHLHELNANELKLFHLDILINNRGFTVDTGAIDRIIDMVKVKESLLIAEIGAITKGYINSVRQIASTMAWIEKQGVEIPNLQKDTVIEVLGRERIPNSVRRLLEIRQSLGKSSVSKFQAMKNWSGSDGRVRGTLMYHGASTGRWTGKGIQPHNYPRDSFNDAQINQFLKLDSKIIDAIYDCTIQAASKCLRGMITAAPGKKLICADYSSIEARVLAWFAKEEKALDAFRTGRDLYKVAASDIYGIPYEEVDKGQRAVGKVSVLALGYQGWIGAFEAMAKGYGVIVPEEQAVKIITNWRKANSQIVAYWKGIENAALEAIKTKQPVNFGSVKFGIRNNFLHCRLPSGRLLAYYAPRIETIVTKYRQVKDVIGFMGEDSVTKKWGPQKTYGGKLTENIVQATARDLLVEGIFKLEEAGFKTLFHVHDEIVAEIGEDENEEETLEKFEQLMAFVPDWAEGCPVEAEGWIGKRYRK